MVNLIKAYNILLSWKQTWKLFDLLKKADFLLELFVDRIIQTADENQGERDKLKHGKSNMDIQANPQITVTPDITENIRRKSRSLPRTLDASKLEDSLKTVEDREISNLIKCERRRRKREKIGSMLNSMAGDKREIMRYDFAVKNLVLNHATSSINSKIYRTSVVVPRVII